MNPQKALRSSPEVNPQVEVNPQKALRSSPEVNPQ